MNSTAEKSTRTVVRKSFVCQLGRWFPRFDAHMIDMRGTGFESKAAVRRWAAEKSGFLGVRYIVSFEN